MKSLADYDISETRGFLSRFNADEVILSGPWAEARQVAMRLPQTLPTGRVRELLNAQLPEFDADAEIKKCSEEQIRLAMVHYSFMVQAYIWGEREAAKVLPAKLAQPMVALADHLGQQPLLPYSGYVLDNWGLEDKDGPVDLDNIYMIQNFLSGQDEIWFVLIHVAIEAAAGGALARAEPLLQATHAQDTDKATKLLAEIGKVWDQINAIFNRMPERCDPYVYFERVRPYIHGWKDNPALPDGVIYEGVPRFEAEGHAFRGQTGSQSSIVPAMDALMGVGHAHDPLRGYLDELHIYRPVGHRKFIEDLREESTVREFVSGSNSQPLRDAYNHVIEAMAAFRSRHLEYAASYINKQGKNATGNDTEVGTGGTPFMKYLKKHRDETRARLL